MPQRYASRGVFNFLADELERGEVRGTRHREEARLMEDRRLAQEQQALKTSIALGEAGARRIGPLAEQPGVQDAIDMSHDIEVPDPLADRRDALGGSGTPRVDPTEGGRYRPSYNVDVGGSRYEVDPDRAKRAERVSLDAALEEAQRGNVIAPGERGLLRERPEVIDDVLRARMSPRRAKTLAEEMQLAQLRHQFKMEEQRVAELGRNQRAVASGEYRRAALALQEQANELRRQGLDIEAAGVEATIANQLDPQDPVRASIKTSLDPEGAKRDQATSDSLRRSATTRTGRTAAPPAPRPPVTPSAARGLPPLSARDRTKAATDARFREYLKGKGYTDKDLR